jgi:hypothetical protein
MRRWGVIDIGVYFSGRARRDIDFLRNFRKRCLKWARRGLVLPCEIAGVKSYKEKSASES